MNREIEIAIVGAGASGLMTGAMLGAKDVVIFEGNSKAGAKILVSGGGKCNVTNERVTPDHYLGDPDFVSAVLERFDQHAMLKWLKKRGLVPVMRKNGHYFCPQSASELLDILKRENSKHTTLLHEKIAHIEKKEGLFYLHGEKKSFRAKNVVIASGGLSFTLLGADEIGYTVAQSFGHTIKRTAPALVGLTLQKEQFFFKELSGVSTEVNITVGEQICSGALLFAHKGISGPAVLDASLYWEKGSITIDFLPGWSLREFLGSKKQLSTILPMPKRLSKAFLEHLDIPDRVVDQLTKEEVARILGLKQYSFAPAGTFGYSKAEVTKGGISTDEIDRDTMMSQKCEGLYFVGEVVDVTGRVGGYNFQWAWSSAYCCAEALSKLEE